MGMYFTVHRKTVVVCYQEYELPEPFPPHLTLRGFGDERPEEYPYMLRQVFEYDPLTNGWDLLLVDGVDDIEADIRNLGFYRDSPRPDFLDEE